MFFLAFYTSLSMIFFMKVHIFVGTWEWVTPSALLYPVSLLIGCWDWVQGGNPLYAAVKCLSVCRGQIWQIFSFFLQKAYGIYPYPDRNFLGLVQFLFTLKIGCFLLNTVTFPKLRGPRQNWGAVNISRAQGPLRAQSLNVGEGPSILENWLSLPAPQFWKRAHHLKNGQ